MEKSKLTPGMRQYMDVKNANPDCIILFRMGDFYETFYEDAKTIARELNITLTSRGKGETKAPLAGIPYHSIDPYLAKLVKKGYKVGIVEQTEDPKKAKGLVKRELVRIVTPGTVFESLILEEQKDNFIMSFVRSRDLYAVCLCDVSTGEFRTAEFGEERFFNELRKLSPAEVIYPMSQEDSEPVKRLKGHGLILNTYDDRFFYDDKANDTLKQHFGVIDLSGFGGCTQLMLNSSGALLSYIRETQKSALPHIRKLAVYRTSGLMYLDASTIRNLELVKNIMNSSDDATLLSVLDRTVTSMGKRMIRRWLLSPLTDKDNIIERLDAVTELKNDFMKRSTLNKSLERVYDIERLIGRVSFGNANPKDLVALRLSLENLPSISSILSSNSSPLLIRLGALPDLSAAASLIACSIKDEPNTTIREGNIIRKGYNAELDELRLIRKDGKEFMASMEDKERESTGIKSLKIKYNRVFGYYIDITKPNLHLVPDNYIRKQTQVNSERFITEELKELESKVLGAEERIIELEQELFIGILENLRHYIPQVQEAAKSVAALDCLNSFANTATDRAYCRPEFSYDGSLEIIDGRHPVIEAFSSSVFVPNSCTLDSHNRTMIITGPNMSGKSTIMRQTAIISLMSQIGSYVPATKATLPIHDRIFTRVGAHDDLVSGQSTFMVEMTETANILNNATENSLIILDEIGRGTSTYDGVSLAWAIAEHIHNAVKAKTLFATHYHQLNDLEKKHDGIRNYSVKVKEEGDSIIFLRKLVEGSTDKSYGIQVAKLAGVPEEVVQMSKRIMEGMESRDEVSELLGRQVKPSKKSKDVIPKIRSLLEFV